MARTNELLNKSKEIQNNEFYAVESEIMKELSIRAYELKGMEVFCNCNDGLHRGFVNVLKKKFHDYGIKSLKYSEYGEGDNNGKIYYYNGAEETVEILDHKGDFRNGRCLEELEKCDVVITGPPYSLAKEFVTLILRLKKKFLIILDICHFSYDEIFDPFFKGDIWLGVNNPQEFIVPASYEDSTTYIGKDGLKRVTLNKEIWLTNIGEKIKKPKYKLKNKYRKKGYKKCDNFDAIWIDDIRHIPKDYNGVMCVSIGFLQKYCEDQFEILGLANDNERVRKYRIPNCEKYDRPYYKGERKIYRLLIRKKTMAYPKRTTKEKEEYINRVIYFLGVFTQCFDNKSATTKLKNFYKSDIDIEKSYANCLRYALEFGSSYNEIMKLPLPTDDDRINLFSASERIMVIPQYHSLVEKLSKRKTTEVTEVSDNKDFEIATKAMEEVSDTSSAAKMVQDALNNGYNKFKLSTLEALGLKLTEFGSNGKNKVYIINGVNDLVYTY